MTHLHADVLITNIGRLVRCAAPNGPLRGAAMARTDALEHAAVAVRDGRIVAVGPAAELAGSVTAATRLDVQGMLATPGFVDPHTHACYAGDRADEFEMRLSGVTYQELMAGGGGIMRTVRETRGASIKELVAQTLPRLDRMLAHGTTTVEIKTGYGLSVADELKMLDAILELERRHPLTIVPTFLGAHAIPAEYRDDPDAYTALVIEELLPAAAEWMQRHQRQLFCDVFCETGAFTLAQSRAILERARELGFGLKLHVDEFDPLGGTPLAVELGATSADHLVATTPEQVAALAASNTVAVSLPGTPFGLGSPKYTPARALIDAGGALALATDCNPGTSVCESLPLIIALACRAMRLRPIEALHATTINAAYAVGLGGEVGSIEVGKRADLALFDLPHERYLAYRFGSNPVAQVVKGGSVVWSK